MQNSIKNDKNRQNFIEAAEPRVNRIKRALDQIAECANPDKFEYTMTDVAQIESAVLSSLDEMKSRFVHSKKTSFSFTLSGE